jgi:uncharacterized protein GlcG (DUF336 family)
MMNIDLDLALEVIGAAKKKSKEIGVPMVIAVVDGGGNLVAQQRMDGAILVSVDISRNKAYTAVAVKISTNDLAGVTQSGQPLFGLHNADGGRIVIFGGGIPLVSNGEIIGGIGVSGGSVEEDVQCATAGVAKFEALSKKKG